MFLSSLNFFGGQYYGNDLDFSISLDAQKNNLVQDICQISYKSRNLVIDVGWYPEDLEITNESHFKIFIIKNNDWHNPCNLYKVYQLDNLKAKIEEIIKSQFGVE